MSCNLKKTPLFLSMGALILVSGISYMTRKQEYRAPIAYLIPEIRDSIDRLEDSLNREYEEYLAKVARIKEERQLRETKAYLERKRREEAAKEGLFLYTVEVTTTPQNQIYSGQRVGNTYQLSRMGVGPSRITYQFTSNKLLSMQEAADYVDKYPNRCWVVPNGTQGQSNIYDNYHDNYEEYIMDPEDEITYPAEIYDFLKD